MAGGAETPNIAALPAIARLGADRKATVQFPRLPAQILVSNLLFKGNVNQVVIRDHSELGAKVVTKIETTQSAPPFARGYVETTIAPFR
jgi:hypothetical protein